MTILSMSARALPIAGLFGLAAAITGAPAAGQCSTQLLPADAVHGQGVAGVNGTVYATATWDPDGAGPAGAVLIVAGGFTQAGSVATNNIAAFDPVAGTWSALGNGTDGEVRAVTVAASGDLVIGGAFTTAGGA